MTTDEPAAAARAFDDHGAFEPADDVHEVTTTPFDATVTASPTDVEGREAAFEVTVNAPSLDAAVAGASVAAVVEDGWFETLELRLEDAYDVAEVDPLDDPDIERRGDEVVAAFTFHAWDADAGVAAAKVIVDYVEGTYVQGIVPGYEYDEPVASLVSRAAQHAGGDDEGAERGGTPL